MQTLWQDARYAFRLLLRSPAFAATSIATLALAIGANTGHLQRREGGPHRAAAISRILIGWCASSKSPRRPRTFRFRRQTFVITATELRTFDGLAAYLRRDLQLGDIGAPGAAARHAGDRRLFHTPWLPARARPRLRPGRRGGGKGDGVILGDGLWRRRFNGDPSAVGQTVRLSGRVFRIIGVLPPGFQARGWHLPDLRAW